MAAQENHLNIVEYLLNNGADQALATDVRPLSLDKHLLLKSYSEL